MTDLLIEHRRQTRRRCGAERAQQVIRVELQIYFFHGRKLRSSSSFSKALRVALISNLARRAMGLSLVLTLKHSSLKAA